jgi:nucleoid DNA-binding protein
MTKPQFLDAVVTATGQSKAEIERTLEAILETAAQAFVSGERIDFRKKPRPARAGTRVPAKRSPSRRVAR